MADRQDAVPQRPAVDTTDYALELSHDAAIRQIRCCIIDLDPKLTGAVARWCIQAEQADTLPWENLQSILNDNDDSINTVQRRCSQFREFCERKNDGLIVPISKEELTPKQLPEVTVGLENTAVQARKVMYASIRRPGLKKANSSNTSR